MFYVPRFFLFSVLFLVFYNFELFALPRVRIVAKAEYLELINQNQNFAWESFFELSLSASGISFAERNVYREKLRTFIDELKVLLPPLSSDYEKGDFILRYIYKFLTKYDPLQTRMDTMFNSGSYNCVSSAILYTTLARVFGLNVFGIGTPEHAFANVYLPDGRYIDVETTSIYGFDPGQKKEFIDTFTSQTGLVYVPKKKYSKREPLNDRVFISLILQNRLYILNQNQISFRILEQMIPLAADLATLTQEEVDIQNFFSMVSQYSFLLSQDSNVEESLLFTDMILDTYGERDSIIKVRNAIAYNDILSLINFKNYELAKNRLALYHSANKINSESYNNLLRALKTQKLEDLINSSTAQFDEKLTAVQDIMDDNILSPHKLEELYQVLYSNEVYSLLKESKFHRAQNLLKSYPKIFQQRPFYQNLYKEIENIYISDVYNSSVIEINKGAYLEAGQIISKGLEVYPQNKLLLQLYSELSKIQSELR